MTKQEQLDDVRRQLREARQAQEAADAAFDTAASVVAATTIATLERYESTLIPEVERETFEEAKALARGRLQSLHSAVGSHAASYEKDIARLAEAHAALVDAAQRLNERFSKLETCELEFRALTDRFGTHDMADLPPLPAPPSALYRRFDFPRLNEHWSKLPEWEKHPDTLKKRRTYREVEGTKAGEIIALVGPFPFDPGHPLVLKAAERRKAEVERAMELGAALAPSEAADPSALLSRDLTSRGGVPSLHLGEVTEEELEEERAREKAAAGK